MALFMCQTCITVNSLKYRSVLSDNRQSAIVILILFQKRLFIPQRHNI